MSALPPPEILAHLTRPGSSCVIGHRYADEEAGSFTIARCNGRSVVLARDRHGDTVRRISRCSIMLTIEEVDFPKLLRVSNCNGTLRIRHTGDIWTRQLMASARIAPYRLDSVMYEPLSHGATCYRISIAFTPPGQSVSGPLKQAAARRCDHAG